MDSEFAFECWYWMVGYLARHQHNPVFAGCMVQSNELLSRDNLMQTFSTTKSLDGSFQVLLRLDLTIPLLHMLGLHLYGPMCYWNHSVDLF